MAYVQDICTKMFTIKCCPPASKHEQVMPKNTNKIIKTSNQSANSKTVMICCVAVSNVFTYQSGKIKKFNYAQCNFVDNTLLSGTKTKP